MKHLFLCIISLMLLANSNAQINLVPDPSFEDTINIFPNDVRGQEVLHQWRNLDSTKPDSFPFIYYCLDTTYYLPYRLPNSQWCYQQPRTGGGGSYRQ